MADSSDETSSSDFSDTDEETQPEQQTSGKALKRPNPFFNKGINNTCPEAGS
jgi:hypothetical protein